MIAFDTNILVHAHRQESSFHDAAKTAIRDAAEETARWAIPWPCLHEFLAIVTNPRIFKTPTPLPAALEQIETWLGSPSLVLLAEDDGYWAVARDLLERSRVSGGKIHDARIAALAVFHGASALYTADRDFSRFAGLRTVNPLA